MITFHWYGLLIGLGAWAALRASLAYAEKIGIKKGLIETAFWWVLTGGLLGARLYHVIDFWQRYYRFNLLKTLFLWEGGLGIWGGIIGGIFGLAGYFLLTEFHFGRVCVETQPLKRQEPSEEKFFKLLDVAVIGVPLGQAIGRLGNWANGELYGKSGQPLWIYEAGLNLILFVVLWRIGTKWLSAGKITGAYLMGYGLIRIFLENFRPTEIIWKWQGIPVAIIMGGISLLIGGVIWKGRRS